MGSLIAVCIKNKILEKYVKGFSKINVLLVFFGRNAFSDLISFAYNLDFSKRRHVYINYIYIS